MLGGRPAARTASSTPCWRKISMVRALMPRALGWMAVPGWRSTSSDVMPSRDSRIEAVSPTGPPPTIRTGTCVIAFCPRLPDEGRMIKDGQTKESERPGDTGIEGLQHHRGPERPGNTGSAVRGGERVPPRHRLEYCAGAREAPAGRRDGGRADPQSRRHRHHDRGRASACPAPRSTLAQLGHRPSPSRRARSAPRHLDTSRRSRKRCSRRARSPTPIRPPAAAPAASISPSCWSAWASPLAINARTKVSPARRPRRRIPADFGEADLAYPAEARTAAGSRHRASGNAARRPAHGHGLRRSRRGVECRAPRDGESADRLSVVGLGRDLSGEGT